MRVSTALLVLPALAAADQIPIVDQAQSWFASATDAAQSFMAKAPSVPTPAIRNPVDAGAAAIAAGAVEKLTLENWKNVLKPGAATASPGIEEWLVYITGGNKTCFGLCDHAETEWNRSVALLGAARNPPHLAVVDCETEPVLCNAWAVGPPTVYHMLLPQPLPDQSTPSTTVRSISVNRTSITATGIASISLEKEYEKQPPYEGVWHPFDGPLAKIGLAEPLGYAIWGFSKIPSWMFMIGLSFFSRTMMNRKMPQNRPAGAGAAPPAARAS